MAGLIKSLNITDAILSGFTVCVPIQDSSSQYFQALSDLGLFPDIRSHVITNPGYTLP